MNLNSEVFRPFFNITFQYITVSDCPELAISYCRWGRWWCAGWRPTCVSSSPARTSSSSATPYTWWWTAAPAGTMSTGSTLTTEQSKWEPSSTRLNPSFWAWWATPGCRSLKLSRKSSRRAVSLRGWTSGETTSRRRNRSQNYKLPHRNKTWFLILLWFLFIYDLKYNMASWAFRTLFVILQPRGHWEGWVGFHFQFNFVLVDIARSLDQNLPYVELVVLNCCRCTGSDLRKKIFSYFTP